MKKFYIVANPDKENTKNMQAAIEKYLKAHGAGVSLGKSVSGHGNPYTDPEEVPADTECGREGDVKELLDALLEDCYELQERMMLKGCVYRNARPVKESIALNDIVLTRDGDPRVLKLKLYVDGQFLNEFSADGMIVATPTGSTAYNLSAGGPIAQPDGQLMILTPICPHTLTSRTIVFGADSRIRIEIPATNRGSQVAAFDGDTLVRLENGDYIEITKAETVTKVVKLDHRSFLDILKMKMYDA